jgi:outer membrane receptor protein involved in Fe transport
MDLAHHARDERPAGAPKVLLLRTRSQHFHRASAKTMFVSLVLLWTFVFPLTGWAQTGNQASLEGVVKDETGAAMPGVTVTVHQPGKGGFTTVTNESGLYRFPVLSVGVYVLRAERSGFTTQVVENFELHVGARVTEDLILPLATHAEEVRVAREAPLIETSRTQVSATTDSRSIASLPVNGRDFTSFALLIPGVTMDVRGGLSFGGQRAMNSVLVDGVSANDNYWGQAIGAEGFPVMGQSEYSLSLETVQEFQVNSNAYSAELGRAAGGVVNVITKSGTDQFQATVFEFYRDKSLNANSVVNERLGLPKDPFHFHQFGGLLGGPIVRRRLSFFLGYDSLRSNVANGVSLSLPAGFKLSPDPLTADSQQRALDYLTARAGSWSFPRRQDDWLTKLDWQTGPAHALSIREIRKRGESAFSGLPQRSRENALPATDSIDIVAGSLTSTLSASTVNVARLAYTTTDSAFLPVSADPMADVFEQDVLVLTIGRNSGARQDFTNRRVQWSDTLSWLHGRHAFKVGADILLADVTYSASQNFFGRYKFQSLASFGDSLANAPLPRPNESFLQAFSGFGTAGVTTHPDSDEYAAFVQDEWRVGSTITVNAGLRYDLQVMGRPPVSNPSPVLAEAELDTSFRPIDFDNVAPRLGMAWSPNPRFVARGGYGVFYAPTPSALAARAHFLNGITVQQRVFRSGTPAAELIPAYPYTACGPTDPSGVPPNCSAPQLGGGPPFLMMFSPTYRDPYTQQGTAGIEFAAGSDLTVALSYLHVKGSNLQWVRDINLAGPTTEVTIGIANTPTRLAYQKYTQPRPLAGFDRVSIIDSGGSSIYHGLAVSVNKRFTHHSQFSLSYTLSKTVDDNPNVYAINPGGNDSPFLSDPLDPSADRSASVNDRRHRFVLSGIWQPSVTTSASRGMRAFLDGWDVAGIVTAQSGRPYSGLVNSDLNNDGNSQTDRTPGLGRNTFNLPAMVSVDLRLARSFPLAAHVKMQLIAEAFNLLNNANVTAVNTTQYAVRNSSADCGIAGTPCLKPLDAGLSAFGTATETAGPRVVQFGVKFLF